MIPENIIEQNGYLVDSTTGKKVVFYECDPQKNIECDKALCRANIEEGDSGFGFCAKTTNPAFRKDGGRMFYAVMKEDTYWGREYIGGDTDD